MLKSYFTVLFLFCFGMTLVAQNKTSLIPVGSAYIKAHPQNEVRPIYNVKLGGASLNKSVAPAKTYDAKGLIDTLSYSKEYDGQYTNFGMFGQDAMVQFFQAPTRLQIKSVGFAAVENSLNKEVQVKLVKFGNGWTVDSMKSLGISLLGYYPSAGDGFNNVGAFPDEATGDWVQVNHTEPFGEDYDLWSDVGFGWPIVPVGNDQEKVYQYVDMMNLGFEPEVQQGEIFGIVLTHQGTETDQATGRVGLYSIPVASSGNAHGWKWYENGRLVVGPVPPGDAGWWSREYTWDFVAIVDYLDDVPPVISGVTNLPTTLSTDAREVSATITDQDPSGNTPGGVASATLKYSVDGGAFADVAMTNAGGDTWTGSIPGQAPGSQVDYYVVATDNNNLSSESAPMTYNIFQPTSNTLVVFNGYDPSGLGGYPMAYYFGAGDWPNSYATYSFSHDVWAYGELTAELVNNYSNILEFATSGPADINSDVIRAWLEADGSHNYLLAGDEWLGTQTNWTNSTYGAGTFQFDILGINADHNDVNYAASGDQNLPSEIKPQQGSLLGGGLYDLHAKVSSDSSWTAPMTYDPYYEIGVTNWLDGVDFESDVQVDFVGVGIDGTEYNIGGHRTLSAGNKVAFLAFDPLAVSSDTQNEEQYYWYGFSDVSAQREVLDWFGIVASVRETDNSVPQDFTLSQNYPNPFNPSTKINFSVPEAGFVSLNVYNLLGEKVATLVNQELKASNYEVDFNAANLASGLYVYTLSTGKFTSSKKMVLMK